MPHEDFKDPIYFSLLPAPRIFRTLVYPSHNFIDQKLNTGNHKEGSSHLNSQCKLWQGPRRPEEGRPI